MFIFLKTSSVHFRAFNYVLVINKPSYVFLDFKSGVGTTYFHFQ